MFIVPILIMTIKAFNDTGRISLWKTINPIPINAVSAEKTSTGFFKRFKKKTDKENSENEKD